MWSTSWAHLEHQAMAEPIVAQRAQHELGLWRPWSSESQRSQRSQRSVGADGQGFPAASRTFRWDQGLLMIHDYINTNININYNMIIIHSRIPAHFLRSNCEADRFSLPAYLASNHVDVWVTGSYMYSIAFKPRKQTRGKLGNINIICFVDLCWRRLGRVWRCLKIFGHWTNWDRTTSGVRGSHCQTESCFQLAGETFWIPICWFDPGAKHT